VLCLVQIINTVNGEKSWMKEELERINAQLQKQTATNEGHCFRHLQSKHSVYIKLSKKNNMSY